VADVALLPRGVAVGVQSSKAAGFAFRVGALLLFLANWVYLLAAGR
jgi:hypothetical protein